MMLKTKKAQTNGLITGLIFGVASLVIAVIIAFVIINTLLSSDLLTDDATTTLTTLNESEAGGGTVAYLNGTTYQLGLISNSSRSAYTIIIVRDFDTDLEIASGNWTLNSATGIISNRTATTYSNVSFSYTTVAHTGNGTFDESANNLNLNYTKGIDNVSSKIPTVLLVAAIVLILGVLAILVGVWQRMNISGSSI